MFSGFGLRFGRRPAGYFSAPVGQQRGYFSAPVGQEAGYISPPVGQEQGAFGGITRFSDRLRNRGGRRFGSGDGRFGGGKLAGKFLRGF